ncbi:MAG: [FeFe] hydrogenase H-cluster radical SAM maturase HydE [Bacteroidales bacterium]|nr:[FeFe] hydrogenase H-cluster radical SAM maturase HydE [Bacteroidales bacterium]
MDMTFEDIKALLAAEGEEMERLLRRALEVKLRELDNYVHLRGLIEFGNVCEKNCLYCGLRRGNARVERYCLSDDEVLSCARLAHELGYGSVALQSGERSDPEFIARIERLVREIKKIDGGSLGITLSLGEQTEDTYRRWFDAGAHRYLLRIESSNEELYYKIHPRDPKHSFSQRIGCLESLLKTGYQTGTGVMVGLPFQTLDHLACDLLFFKKMDVAMVGLGPYIPHPDTPLYKFKDLIPSAKERMDMTLKMIAVLRLMMPRINMVAATANQTIDPQGREKAIKAGANVIMPNLTPGEYRESYFIYPDKACVKDTPDQCQTCLDIRLAAIGHRIQYNAWGDSLAFTQKNTRK